MKYTDEFLIDELHRWVKENDRVPTTDAWDASNGYPSRFTYQRRFGSWGTVLTMGGYPANKRGVKPGAVRGERGKIVSGYYLQEERETERGSVQMIEWRKNVIERDRTCRLCGTANDLHTHHILGYKEYECLRLDVDNGLTVCNECHCKIHYGKLDIESERMLIDMKINILNKIRR